MARGGRGPSLVSMTREFPAGDIRVSDADRDLALAELSEHFQTGRLTQDEFDERSGRALRAKTGGDLRELFTDLPAHERPGLAPDAAQGPAPAQPPAAPVRAGRRMPTARLVIVCVIVAIVLGNVLGNLGHGFDHLSFGWVIPVVILLIVARRIGHR
jgi:Domain of unknown function (DUF1707)